MRLTIDFDEKYRNLFDELIEVTDAVIIEEYPSIDLPPEIREKIEKARKQVANGQTKTYDEVKTILNSRFSD